VFVSIVASVVYPLVLIIDLKLLKSLADLQLYNTNNNNNNNKGLYTHCLKAKSH